MQKTYITRMPNRAGALLQASRVIAEEGGNIVRVNYHKAVDLHTLFLDVEAEPEPIHRITKRLTEIGYLSDAEPERQVMLIEMKLEDVPGTLQPILEILQQYEINISYINSQSTGTDCQHFKMGLYIERPDRIKELLRKLSEQCDVRILEYSVTEKTLDSTVFYIGFAGEMRELLHLTQRETNRMIVESNRIMQFLEERDETPFKTFEYIRSFAKFIVEHKGENFHPLVEEKQLSAGVHGYIIEPPCGSNVYVLDDGEELLLIDGGFPCYQEETLAVLRERIEGYDARKKRLFLTHADIDHVGLLPLFDDVLVSDDCRINLACDYAGEDNFREQNPLHAPYCRLSKLITGYVPSTLSRLHVIGKKTDDAVLSHLGSMSFGDMCFQIYQGNGGHVKGETVLLDAGHKVAFTGDNLVNIRGFSDDQKAFNTLAPYLMTSVNVDSAEATRCRKYLLQETEGFLVCPGHGMWEQRE